MKRSQWEVKSKKKKNHKCDQCYYAQLCSTLLNRHLRTHSGEKPNKCNRFNFSSSQAGKLRIYLKTCTGEKPNKWSKCDFASILCECIMSVTPVCAIWQPLMYMKHTLQCVQYDGSSLQSRISYLPTPPPPPSFCRKKSTVQCTLPANFTLHNWTCTLFTQIENASRCSDHFYNATEQLLWQER